MMAKVKGPVLIEMEEAGEITPATAPAVPDEAGPPEGRAMKMAARAVARRGSRLGRFFWTAAAALVSFVAGVAAWDFVTGLLERNPVLGAVAAGLLALFVLAALLLSLRELAGFARLKRLDRMRKEAERALAASDLQAARHVAARLSALYTARPETEWGRARLADRRDDASDAEAMLVLTEAELLAPLDAAARAEVEAAARMVATVTAVVPLALADVAAALTANLRMIRRIAEIYGGRAGTLGSWRVARGVLTHLVATGAVAVGDDLIQSVAGGGLLSKISRRFGEGVVNGALTARVGVAAIEVCRPLPYLKAARPTVTSLVKRALSGLFGTRD